MEHISIEQILAGTSIGQRQSVGYMDIIPILGDDDNSFAPPTIEISSPNYGIVNLRNNNTNPTIIPTGAGWIVKQAVQDHAIGTALIIPGKTNAVVETAKCIQETQGGHISSGTYEMLVLPTQLRNKALNTRNQNGYNQLWEPIKQFNTQYDIQRDAYGHLEYFLNQFKKELDQFVAEFELVPNQVGAIVVVGDQIVGIERAPSFEFWAMVWTPLIRVCYGSLALKLDKQKQHAPTKTRTPLDAARAKSLKDIEKALTKATQKSNEITNKITLQAKKALLKHNKTPEMTSQQHTMFTAASNTYAGQFITEGTNTKYASIFARA
jgi:hypothetical protein